MSKGIHELLRRKQANTPNGANKLETFEQMGEKHQWRAPRIFPNLPIARPGGRSSHILALSRYISRALRFHGSQLCPGR